MVGSTGSMGLMGDQLDDFHGFMGFWVVFWLDLFQLASDDDSKEIQPPPLKDAGGWVVVFQLDVGGVGGVVVFGTHVCNFTSDPQQKKILVKKQRHKSTIKKKKK